MNQKIVELTKQFAALKTQYEEQETKLKEINETWTAVEAELLDSMVEEGVNSVKIDGIGLFSMRTTNFLSVAQANTEEFYKYLKESGNGKLIKEYVNPLTMKAFLKEHCESLTQEKINAGGDPVDSRTSVLEFLSGKGAAYYTKRDIAFKRGK